MLQWMRSKKAFTFVELIGALFICSLLFVYFLPNIVRQYTNIVHQEKILEMKEILYEEILLHEGKEYRGERGVYYVEIVKGKARIEDKKTNEEVRYE